MRSGSAVSTMMSWRILLWSIRRRLTMGRFSPCRDTNSRTLGLSEPREDDAALGIEQRRADGRRQSVEIGVLVGRDDRRDLDE